MVEQILSPQAKRRVIISNILVSNNNFTSYQTTQNLGSFGCVRETPTPNSMPAQRPAPLPQARNQNSASISKKPPRNIKGKPEPLSSIRE